MKKFFLLVIALFAMFNVANATTKLTLILDTNPKFEIRSDELFKNGIKVPTNIIPKEANTYIFFSGTFIILEINKNDVVLWKNIKENSWTIIEYESDYKKISLSLDNNCLIKINSIREETNIFSAEAYVENVDGSWEPIYIYFISPIYDE